MAETMLKPENSPDARTEDISKSFKAFSRVGSLEILRSPHLRIDIAHT
jgi:hypothetical protein